MLGVRSDLKKPIQINPEINGLYLPEFSILMFGQYQDRSSDKLIGYVENLQDHSIEEILVFEKISKSNEDYTYLLIERKDFSLTTGPIIVKFIKGKIPFYIDKDYFICNRKHEKTCFLSPYFYVSGLLTGTITSDYTKIINISSDKCLFWQPKHVLGLYFNDIILFYRRSLTKQQSESLILVDDVVMKNFELTDDIVNHLKSIDTFQEAVNYLKQQLIFYSL
jgi:hypothetical protein